MADGTRILGVGAEPAEEQGSNALGDDGKPIYQQQPRNPKKGKKKRK